MKTFEEFKASREKMDPSTRKMSEHQWGQAYSAYCSARENTRSSRSSSSKSGGHRRRSSSKSSSHGMHTPSTVSASGQLRAQVRADSAYADLRLIVNVLAGVVIGIIVLMVVLQSGMFATATATGLALLTGVVQALGVVVLRMVVHVIIDIPDVALYRASSAQQASSVVKAD